MPITGIGTIALELSATVPEAEPPPDTVPSPDSLALVQMALIPPLRPKVTFPLLKNEYL